MSGVADSLGNLVGGISTGDPGAIVGSMFGGIPGGVLANGYQGPQGPSMDSVVNAQANQQALINNQTNAANDYNSNMGKNIASDYGQVSRQIDANTKQAKNQEQGNFNGRGMFNSGRRQFQDYALQNQNQNDKATALGNTINKDTTQGTTYLSNPYATQVTNQGLNNNFQNTLTNQSNQYNQANTQMIGGLLGQAGKAYGNQAGSQPTSSYNYNQTV